MAFSIEDYKRRLQVHAAQSTKRGKSAPLPADLAFAGLQKKYLDFCVNKHVDADQQLLGSLKSKAFSLILDRLSDAELSVHMEFLQKTSALRQICLSLGTTAIDRDVKKKFVRLGIARSPAYKSTGAALVVRSACAASTNSPDLVRFQLRGVAIHESLASLLSQALKKTEKLEMVDLRCSKLGDKGVEALSIAIGRHPHLRYLCLSGCSLTDAARSHLTKIIALQGTIRDEAVWSASLRGATAPPDLQRPELILDLSRNELGDATCEALSAALYHDKWVVGLNLAHNNITHAGMQLLFETLQHSNSTLAVLHLMSSDSVSTECLSLVHSIDAITRKRIKRLRCLASDSNERRLFLCNVLLEWQVNRDVVVRLCGDTTGQSNRDVERSNQAEEQHSEVKSEEHGEFSPESSHVHTIKFLIDRLSAMEAEQAKAAERMARLDEENARLRAEIQSLRSQTTGESPALEEMVINQLESSISILAQQIEALEEEKRAENQ